MTVTYRKNFLGYRQQRSDDDHLAGFAVIGPPHRRADHLQWAWRRRVDPDIDRLDIGKPTVQVVVANKTAAGKPRPAGPIVSFE